MKYGHLLSQFKDVRTVVLGDLMVDEYIFGKATRISPEAPVMVVKHSRTTRLPGGAANVARNIAALGSRVRLVGVVGDDRGAELLAEALEATGLTDFYPIAESYRTTGRKVRVLADARQQALRIDFEDDMPIKSDTEARLLATLEKELGRADLLLISDYDKGTLTRDVCEKAIALAQERNVFVAANPKPSTVGYYAAANLVSLNRVEAKQALQLSGNPTAGDFVRAATELEGDRAIMITLGEEGMLAVKNGEAFVAMAPKVEVYDTAGAGDTAIATAALGMAVAGFSQDVFDLAALASASVVRHVGVATPTQADLDQLQ